jgi:hypothetical protein
MINCKNSNRIYTVICLTFLFFSQLNAQKLSVTGRMIENNVPVLDSLEKASMPRMVLLEDAM